MLRRQCTKEYKIEVIERCIRREILGLNERQHVPKDVLVFQYIGTRAADILHKVFSHKPEKQMGFALECEGGCGL